MDPRTKHTQINTGSRRTGTIWTGYAHVIAETLCGRYSILVAPCEGGLEMVYARDAKGELIYLAEVTPGNVWMVCSDDELQTIADLCDIPDATLPYAIVRWLGDIR
jgi:hypothetical protein